MIRALTVLFVLLCGALLWFRLGPAAPARVPDAASGAPSSAEKRPAAAVEYAVLPVKTLSDGLPTVGEWRGKPVARDLNGDGKLDLVTSIRRIERDKPGDGIHVYLGDGTGRWKPCDQGLSDVMGYGGADVADVNGDGRPDIAYSGHDIAPKLFLNFLEFEGDSDWVEIDGGLQIKYMCSDVALGDFDRDGDADLVSLGFFPKTGGLHTYVNDGQGMFQLQAELLEPVHYGAIVRLLDLDGDGGVELIGATSLGAKAWAWNKDGWIDQSKGLPATDQLGDVQGIIRAIDAKDVDGDGRAEIAVAGIYTKSHRALRLYRRTGAAWEAWGRGLPTADESVFDVAFARLGAHGSGLFAAGQEGVLVIRIGRDGVSTVLGRIAKTADILNLCAGDVDGDGTDEVFCVGRSGVRAFALDKSTLAAAPAMEVSR